MLRGIKNNIDDNLKTTAKTVDIDNIHFCVGVIEKLKEDDNDLYINLVYAANIGKMAIDLMQSFVIESESLKKQYSSLITSGLFMINGGSIDLFLHNTISFFIENKDKYITDFDMVYNENTKRYEFYAEDDSNSMIKFTISKSVNIGLNIMSYALYNNMISRDFILGANEWLSNRVKSCINAEFYSINGFEVIDKSKTSKYKKNIYTGVAAIKFKVSTSFNIDKEFICVIPYIVNKAIRDRHKTKDIKLMEVLYKDEYTISHHRGIYQSSDNSTLLQLIAYNSDETIVLDIPSKEMKNIYKAIEE